MMHLLKTGKRPFDRLPYFRHKAESQYIFTAHMTRLDFQQVIGITAGTLTTLSFLPQLIRTVRTRSARDLSLGMVCFFIVGIVLWLMYGIMACAWPIILTNAVTFVLASVLLVFIIRYRK
jgi:MtN3 and saliva related transmembrane protein